MVVVVAEVAVVVGEEEVVVGEEEVVAEVEAVAVEAEPQQPVCTHRHLRTPDLPDTRSAGRSEVPDQEFPGLSSLPHLPIFPFPRC